MFKRRLLLICERVGTQGGMERYLQIIVRKLLSAQCEIRILARQVEEINAFGAPVERIEWSDEHDGPAVDAGRRVRATIQDFSPDVVAVHSCLDSAVLQAARTAPRVIAHLHDHRAFCPNGDRLYPQGGGICSVKMGGACMVHALIHGCAYGPRRQTLELIALREKVRRQMTRADRVVVMSEYMAMLAQRNGCDSKRIAVLDPPLATDAFGARPEQAPNTDRVLFVGRVVPQKGLALLVRAIARISAQRRPELAVAGDGPALSEVSKDAQARNVRLVQLGFLGAAAVRDAIDNARAVAVPSIWGEPFGLAGIEAFARGRPVVAFDSGAIREWIGKGGKAVERGNVAALGQAIERLQDDAVWLKTAQWAWRSAQRFDCGRHTDELLRLYDKSPTLPR